MPRQRSSQTSGRTRSESSKSSPNGASCVAPVELILLRSEGDPSTHTLAWRERTGARAHYFLHPWDEEELASFARQVAGRGVGLVLGGGGARGFAHIGVLRALEELKIPVDLVGGTSMGAFIGALVACGLDSVEIAHTARETFVTRNYLNDYALPRVSLIRGRRFTARLEEIFEARQIEELRRTYFCVSTNLTTGATVVHDRGPLYAWVGTSMSIPGFAPPIAYEGELLCDGAVVDNLPTDVMQGLERGPVLASNVSTEGDLRATGEGIGAPDGEALLNRRGKERLPRLNEILMRSATLTSSTSVARALERADVCIRMPLQEFGSFDWKRIEELVELGQPEPPLGRADAVVGAEREDQPAGDCMAVDRGDEWALERVEGREQAVDAGHHRALPRAVESRDDLEVRPRREEALAAGDHERLRFAAGDRLERVRDLVQELDVERVGGRAIDADERKIPLFLDADVLPGHRDETLDRSGHFV